MSADSEASVAYFYDTLVASFHLGLVRPVHRHGASQLTISLDGVPHLVGPDDAHLRPGLVHFADAHAAHHFDGRAGEQLLLWLAPASRDTRALRRNYLGDAGTAKLPDTLVDSLDLDGLRRAHRERWSGTRLEPLIEQLMSRLSDASPAPPRPIHPAVRAAVRIIQGLAIKKISADVLAAEVGLSKSRLLHLLKEHLGIPLRPYLAWLRCIDAIVLMSQGDDATRAAVCAGFADGAHFNRVMRERFGLSPSQLATRTIIEVCTARLED